MYKLGKLPAKNDPRDFGLNKYLLPSALPAVPKGDIDWTKPVKRWPKFLNDQIGDCTCAGAAHVIMTAHANVNRYFTPLDAQVLKAYQDISGYDPRDPNTDRGAYLTDVLNYWRKTGIAGNKIGAYVKVNIRNKSVMRAALYLFGSLYCGFMLPVTAGSQFDKGQSWHVVSPSLTGDSAPGSWGGHCVSLFKNTSYGYVGATWGKLHPITYDFIAAYMDEAYVVIQAAWIKDTGLAPSGFNTAALINDLRLVA
jgi:hypothetical protein